MNAALANVLAAVLAAGTLWRRELVRFFRQPSRIAGAAGSPLLFWILIGSGLSGSFRLPGGSAGVSFLEYFFPARWCWCSSSPPSSRPSR